MKGEIVALWIVTENDEIKCNDLRNFITFMSSPAASPL